MRIQHHPPWREACSRAVRLDTQSVVHRVSKVLFASEVSLSRLNRYVPQEELDLVQLPSGQMAQAGLHVSMPAFRIY